MSNDVYTMMKNRLGKFDRKMADIPIALELLKMIYTPEEAEFCAKFPDGALTVKALADFYGRPELELKDYLENLIKKGLVFTTIDEKGEKRHEVMPWVPGVLELSVTSHKGTPWVDQFNALYAQYSKEAAAIIDSYAGNVEMLQSILPEPDVRTMPLKVSLTPTSAVYDFENIMDLISKETYFVAMPCHCRTLSKVQGTPCKHGLPEYSCLSFGKAARHYSEYGFGKKITKEECIAIVETAAKAGAIHNANNYTEALQYLCNCCPDCCNLFKKVKLMGNVKLITPSNFVAVSIREDCTGCGVCVERCPVDAVTISDGVALINSDVCIGCGSCVVGCPSKARFMERRSEYKPTLENRKVGMGY